MTYYETHKEAAMESMRRYRKSHPEKMRKWAKTYRDRYPDKVRAYREKRNAEWKRAAYLKIAEHWGDLEPRCRIDLTPNTPVSDLPCRGDLEIDHINGGGRKERRSGVLLYKDIAIGRRESDDLRVLCELHQLWNRIGKKKGPPIGWNKK